MWKRGKFSCLLIIVQFIIILIYTFKSDYGADGNASDPMHSLSPAFGGKDPKKNDIELFQDGYQHARIAILIALNIFGQSNFYSITIEFLINSIAMQILIIFISAFKSQSFIFIGVSEFFEAIKFTIALSLTKTALIGKCSLIQYLIIVILECPILVANHHLGEKLFQVSDSGGGIYLIVFGTYFGLSIVFALKKFSNRTKNLSDEEKQTNYLSLISAIIFTTFWPNIADFKISNDAKHRITINATLCTCSALTFAFAFSSLIDHKNRVDIRHIFTAAISSTVIVASIGEMMIMPYIALIFGFSASLISIISSVYIRPKIFHQNTDTNDIQSIFGIPGIVSGLLSALYALLASEKEYGYTVYKLYPARAPIMDSTYLDEIQSYYNGVNAGIERSNMQQALMQLLYLVTTLIIAVISGMLVGLMIRHSFFSPITSVNDFEKQFVQEEQIQEQ